MTVVILDVASDSVFQIGNRVEDAAPDAPSRDDGEKALDGVQPGGLGRREVKDLSGMISQPGVHLGALVGSVIVKDDMDDLACRNLPLHGVEELDEFLMAMPFHATAHHGSVQNIERSK